MVVPWWLQAAEMAKKIPAVVRATITPLCTKYPPLDAKAPVLTSIVKSTFVGNASAFLQPVNPPIQAGIKSAAAPMPNWEKKSFLSILFSSELNAQSIVIKLHKLLV
jgi:hypothetical protein